MGPAAFPDDACSLRDGPPSPWRLALTAGAAGPGAPYRAADLSLSGSVGWPLGGWLAPYAAAKVFGGPVTWEQGGAAVTGTDLHHYQVAVGLAAALPRRFDLLVEWAPLGARAVTAALGRSL